VQDQFLFLPRNVEGLPLLENGKLNVAGEQSIDEEYGHVIHAEEEYDLHRAE